MSCVQTRIGSVSFPDVAEAAFGPMGRWLAGMLAYVDLFAMGVGCMILAACSFEVTRGLKRGGEGGHVVKSDGGW